MSYADIGFRCSHDSVWTQGSVSIIFFSTYLIESQSYLVAAET